MSAAAFLLFAMKRLLKKYLSWFICLAALLFGVDVCISDPLPNGIYARMITSKGEILFHLFYDKVPLTVSNFIALAEGSIPWKDPAAGILKQEPFYDGLTFYRIIPELMVQSGDPKNNGHGGPEYCIRKEIHPRLTHDGAGILSMINDRNFSHGSRFFITLKDAPFLDTRHAVFGKAIKGIDVLARLEQGDRIEKIMIRRVGHEAESFDEGSYIEQARIQPTGPPEKKIVLPSTQGERKFKRLPVPTGKVDIASVPLEGQPPAEKIALEYILLTHEGSTFPSVHTQCSKEAAYDAALRLTQLAREPGRNFRKLALRYSDSTVYRIPLLLRSEHANSSYQSCFFLREGQVSDPVDTPEGYVVFKRVRLDIIKVRHILIAHEEALVDSGKRAAAGMPSATEQQQSGTAGGKGRLRSKEEAKELAESILRKLLAGEDFAALAEKYSDSASGKNGGDIGEIARGMSVPPFDHAAFSLKVGDVSPVTHTPAGFQIIKRIE